jgi:hypothetical protein
MKVTLQSTRKIVTFETDTGHVEARVWQGETETGVPVQAFITRIAPEISPNEPGFDAAQVEFERDLRHTSSPRPAALDVIPARMIL